MSGYAAFVDSMDAANHLGTVTFIIRYFCNDQHTGSIPLTSELKYLSQKKWEQSELHLQMQVQNSLRNDVAPTAFPI